MKKLFFLVMFLFFCANIFAQQKLSLTKFITPSDSLNKKRELGVHAANVAVFSGAMVWLNYEWYANYPRSNFHFFDDNGEWLQMDKCGHAYSAYSEAYWSSNLYQWAGVSQRRSVLYGAIVGEAMQLTIEVMDGFSKEWGFSKGDFEANTLGSGLLLGQELLWREQRVHLKFSTHKNNYGANELEQRANELYGKPLPERILKDYNAQTYWLSVNISSFLKPQNKFPKWLNIAAGYGADGMFGAYHNTWSYDANGKPLDDYFKNNAATNVDYSQVKRYRQFYLSPDIDFSKIKTKSKFLKTLFLALNVIKLPAPTLEYNSLGQTKFHFLYF